MKHIRKFLSIILVFICLISSGVNVMAYDMSAEHKVNLYYKNPEEVAKIQKILYAEMLTWGMTEAGCSGVIGNMMAESGCDYTRTQSNKPWSAFKRGNVGIGLTQWTYPTRQDQLFATADELGKQWCDLSVQIAQLKKELTEGGGYYISELYTSEDVNKCADRFLEVYEKPAVYNYSTRRQLAQTVSNTLKGTKPQSYDGSSSETSTEKNEDDVSEKHVNSVIAEWDLVGMSKFKDSMADSQKQVELATKDQLSIGEQYSVSTIGEDLDLQHKAFTIDTVRVAVVFIGMCMIFYGVMLGLCTLFDKANNFIDISLVKILTFGLLTYSEESSVKGKKGYANSGRIVFVIATLLIVGCLLVSGGVLPFMMDVINYVVDMFTNNR